MNLKKIEDEALHLSEEERAELAQKLPLSLDAPTVGDIDEEWVIEVQRRAREIDAGLGASWLVEFEKNMRMVCEAPHGYPIEKEPDVRRIRMKPFPYIVFFRESSKNVQVPAVAHHRRCPQSWLERI